jgi:predicted deacylase
MGNLAYNVNSVLADKGDYLMQLEKITAGSIVQPYGNSKGVWRVFGSNHGKQVTILAGIHGNEPSGIWAVTRLIKELISGKIELKQGSIILALGNLPAIIQKKRFVGINLNRCFGRADLDHLNHYEVARAKELMPILAETDGVFDLHSTSSESPPFCLTHGRNLLLSTELSLPNVVYGKEDIWTNMVKGTTAGWSEAHGIPAFVWESGQHNALSTYRNAYRHLRLYLDYLGIIAYKTNHPFSTIKAFELYECQYLKNKNFTYFKEFCTLEWLPNNTPIGYYSDSSFTNSQTFATSRTSVMIMPTKPENLVIGEEMYYLALPTIW